MKPGIPWSVKGIDPDIRAAAKDAARRSGMTLGEWLNSVILDQSTDAKRVATSQHETAAKDFSADEEPSGGRDDTTIRLEDIAQQLTRLAQRDQQSASIRAYEQPGRQRQDVESLNRILGRLDSNERQTAEAFTAVNERLSILGDQVSRAVERQPGEAPGYQALETALRNIVDHIEVSEKRTRETLKSMQDRMGDMTQRAAESTVVQQSVPAFNDLEARLNELARRVGLRDGGEQHAAGSRAPGTGRSPSGWSRFARPPKPSPTGLSPPPSRPPGPNCTTSNRAFSVFSRKPRTPSATAAPAIAPNCSACAPKSAASTSASTM
jgi:localization factor PodJL